MDKCLLTCITWILNFFLFQLFETFTIMLWSAKLGALRALVPHVPRTLRALVPTVLLRPTYLVPYVIMGFTCFGLHVPRILCGLVLLRFISSFSSQNLLFDTLYTSCPDITFLALEFPCITLLFFCSFPTCDFFGEIY